VCFTKTAGFIKTYEKEIIPTKEELGFLPGSVAENIGFMEVLRREWCVRNGYDPDQKLRKDIVRLIRIKSASARTKDLADAEELEKEQYK